MVQYFFIKHRLLQIVIIFTVTSFHSTNGQIGITNKATGGWFGDNILHYVKAKWLAYKYNLNFYFQRFDNDHLLIASSKEIMLSQALPAFNRHIGARHEQDIANNLQDGTLFTLEAWAPGFGYETENLITYLLLNSPQEFIDSMQPLLKPTKSIALPSIPTNLITVGVHVRKPLVTDHPLFGTQEFDTSSYDVTEEIIPIIQNQTTQNRLVPTTTCVSRTLYADVNEGSMKFPPTQYYIDQIKKLSVFLNDAPLFVHLFSCNSDQTELYKTIKKGVSKSNIIYADEIIQWDAGLIEDYLAMSSYDCLIKSTSSFSTIAQLIGNHAICIVPSEYIWHDKKLIINKTMWFVREAELNRIKNKAVLNIGMLRISHTLKNTDYSFFNMRYFRKLLNQSACIKLIV